MVDYIDEESFFDLTTSEQDSIMREWLGEFSRNELLAIKHLMEQINRPAETER